MLLLQVPEIILVSRRLPAHGVLIRVSGRPRGGWGELCGELLCRRRDPQSFAFAQSATRTAIRSVWGKSRRSVAAGHRKVAARTAC